MKSIFKHYKLLKSQKAFFLQVLVGLFLLVVSLLLNYEANSYTATLTGISVNDIILDHLPAVKVEDIFYEGGLILAGCVIALGLYKPHRAPFILKSVALFFATRSFFLILTHLAPPTHAIVLPTSNFLERLVSGSGDDLFFSGHTGFPFLMALLFWNDKLLRWLFLAATLLFGASALLGHLHYSIDVFSALFITYGIFQFSKWIFKNDYHFFHQTL